MIPMKEDCSLLQMLMGVDTAQDHSKVSRVTDNNTTSSSPIFLDCLEFHICL